MKLPPRLARDSTGAAAIEFALIAPIFLIIMVGVFQMGMAMHTSAGLRNGVEVAARYAQIYPKPTSAQIIAKYKSATYGMNSGATADPTLTYGTSAGTAYVDISASYTQSYNFLFLNKTAVPYSYSRRAYQY